MGNLLNLKSCISWILVMLFWLTFMTETAFAATNDYQISLEDYQISLEDDSDYDPDFSGQNFDDLCDEPRQYMIAGSCHSCSLECDVDLQSERFKKNCLLFCRAYFCQFSIYARDASTWHVCENFTYGTEAEEFNIETTSHPATLDNVRQTKPVPEVSGKNKNSTDTITFAVFVGVFLLITLIIIFVRICQRGPSGSGDVERGTAQLLSEHE